MNHRNNNSIPAHKFSSWKQLKERADACKSSTYNSRFLIPDDQRQITPPENKSISAWEMEAGGSHDEDSISSLRYKADDQSWLCHLDSSQTKKWDTFISEDVESAYKGDAASSRYKTHSASKECPKKHSTARKSKFLQDCQTKVTRWQSEMLNRSFCLNLNEPRCQSSTDLHFSNVGSQAHTDLHFNEARCQSHSDLHLKKPDCQSNSVLNANKNSGQSHNDLWNLRVGAAIESKSSQFSGSSPVSENSEIPSLSPQLVSYRQHSSQSDNSVPNKESNANPLNQNLVANQNVINNMFNVNVQNENFCNALKNRRNNSSIIGHTWKKNKYNNVRYKCVPGIDLHSDKLYYNCRIITGLNSARGLENTFSHVSSANRPTDAQELSMTPDSLITADGVAGTEHREDDKCPIAEPTRQMMGLGFNVTLLTEAEYINSNLNAKECGDAPSGKQESLPGKLNTNRLLFLDYLLKSEEKPSRPTRRLNVGFRKSRLISKGNIITQRKKRPKNCFLKGILNVMQMKPANKANNVEKRNTNITNVKSIVRTDCITLPTDDSKSTSSMSVESEETKSIVSLYASKPDFSHSSNSAQLSLDSLESSTSKGSAEIKSSDCSSSEHKLDLNSSKKYSNSTLSNKYINGCLFLNKVMTDNLNLLQLDACKGTQGSVTDVSIESDHHEDEQNIELSEENTSQADSREALNNESVAKLRGKNSMHAPGFPKVECDDYIIGIMGNTLISDMDSMYMTSVLKSVNKNPSIKLLDVNDSEEQADTDQSAEQSKGDFSTLALGEMKPEDHDETLDKVQHATSAKSLEQNYFLGDSKTENVKGSATKEASNRTLKPKGPFVCIPSKAEFCIETGDCFSQNRRQYKCFSISRSRIGSSFKRFPHRPQPTIGDMPVAVPPFTTVTMQRTERKSTLVGWHDPVKTCTSPRVKSNVTAFPAKSSSRRGYRKTWAGISKRRKHTKSTRETHLKGNGIATPTITDQCLRTIHILGNLKKVGMASKCSLHMRKYKIVTKCKSLYTRNPKATTTRLLFNSKRNIDGNIEANRNCGSQTQVNLKSTTNTSKSHVPRARSASGQSERLKKLRDQSKSSTTRRDLLKPQVSVRDTPNSVLKQCDRPNSSMKTRDKSSSKHDAPKTKLSDTFRPAPNNSACKNKPATMTRQTSSAPEVRRRDFSVAKIPSLNHEISSSLNENAESRSVFSRLWVSNSKCIGDVSSMCCQLLTDIKRNSALYEFGEDDVKCLWILNKQFKRKDNNKKAHRVGTEIDKLKCGSKNNTFSELETTSNPKSVISCIQAIITKQQIALQAIDDAIQILDAKESVANKSASTVPIDLSKGLVRSKEKHKDCAILQGNPQRSKNGLLKETPNNCVLFNFDSPRCPSASAHRKQCNVRPKQFGGDGCNLKGTRSDHSVALAEPGAKSGAHNTCSTKFYRSPFLLCRSGCSK